MDLETHRKINKIKQDSYKNYVIEKINSLGNNNNKLNEDDIKKTLNLINEDYEEEKNSLINKTIEFFYNHKKYKRFINKDKYTNKIKKYLYIIDNIKSYLKRTYKINNNYSLYYLKHHASSLVDIYKNKKEIYKILRYLILKLSILEEKYSDILKEFYKEVKNYDELKNIRTYESIRRRNILNQTEEMTKRTSIVSNSLKVLKHNTKEVVDNGFFGL